MWSFSPLPSCLWGSLWWRSPTHLTLPLETWAGKPSWSRRLLMRPNLSWKHGAMRPWENINIKNVQTRGFQGRGRDANNGPRGEVGCSWVFPCCSLVLGVPSVQPCLLFGPDQTLMGFQCKTGDEILLGSSEVELLILLHVVRWVGDKSGVYPTGSNGTGCCCCCCFFLKQMPSKLHQVWMWPVIDCRTSYSRMIFQLLPWSASNMEILLIVYFNTILWR